MHNTVSGLVIMSDDSTGPSTPDVPEYCAAFPEAEPVEILRSLRSFERGYRGDAEIFIDGSKILEARIAKTRSSPPPAGPSDRVCENEAGVMSSKTS